MAIKNFIPAAARSWLSNYVTIKPSPRASAPDKPINSVFGNPSSKFQPPPITGSLKSFRVPKPRERKEAMRNSRHLRAQLGIVKALFEQTARYSLGNGLVPTSSCEDKEFRNRADDYFHAVTSTKKFDIRGDSTFSQMQKTVLPDVICDGDAGAIPIRDREGNPRIQLFPAEAIGDHHGSSIFDGLGRWDDGVMRSESGERIAYRILKEHQPGMPGHFQAYSDYAAENFFHIGKVDRINGNRPMPWLHHGDQSAINILDLNNLEMAATRLNSYFAAAIKTSTGDIPVSIADLMGDDLADDGKSSDGDVAKTLTKAQEAEKRIIELYGQAAILPLEDNQEFQFFKHDRGTASVTEFINYLIADMSVGFGVPWQFVWGMTGLAGPYARLVMQQADWFFNDVADMMVCDFCQPVWEGIIEDGMNRGLLAPPEMGTNWRAVTWQGPGSLTIDKGRDGKLYLEQIKSGLGRRSNFYRATGAGGINECYKDIDEVADLMAYCDSRGVPYELYFGREFSGAGSAGPSPGRAAPDPAGNQLPPSQLSTDEIAASVVEMMLDQGLILRPND